MKLVLIQVVDCGCRLVRSFCSGIVIVLAGVGADIDKLGIRKVIRILLKVSSFLILASSLVPLGPLRYPNLKHVNKLKKRLEQGWDSGAVRLFI